MDNNQLHIILHESGLTVNYPPEKCITTQETIYIIRNLKKNLENNFNYPRNVSDLYEDLEKQCRDWDIFKHYLFPNIVRINDSGEHPINVSVIRILLNIPILQPKLIEYIFKKAIDLAADSKCGPWIQMILKCISSLDSIVDVDRVSMCLIDLLDISTEKMVRLEIIIAIPDIIGDQQHNTVAIKLSRILSEDCHLIPAILDCLSYLSLSDEQYENLQKKTLTILMSLSKCTYFSNFIVFLLMPRHMNDTAYLDTVHGLRNALSWSTSIATSQEIATSQVLTAKSIRNSMLSSKAIANAWLKAISMCKISTDLKPIDFIILLILYSTTDERQKQVEALIRKQITLNILKEELLDETLAKFKLILKNYLIHLIELVKTLMITKTDPAVESFACYLYMLMFDELENCCQTIVAKLLQMGLDYKQCAMNVLFILNNVADKDMSLLKPQSVQLLTLLDSMDDMSLNEIRAVMNLVCGLAYSYENSAIRNDIDMLIKKELSSSIPTIKIQGILAGVHAVKYLMQTDDDEEKTIELHNNSSYIPITHLPEGDLQEAAQIIELISCSTKQFPDMIAFFYDELSKIISTVSHINKHFMSWLTVAVTNDLQSNFIVDCIQSKRIGELKLAIQYCLNAENEMEDVIAVNIAGVALQSNHGIDVGILSPLFQLVQTLHSKQHDGDLSKIDALLGCPIVMPKFDVDLIEDIDHITVSRILDCLLHCVNWFRELLNGFAGQDVDVLKTQILNRVLQIQEIEILINEILLKSKIMYKPPICTFNVKKYTREQMDRKPTRAQNNKQKVNKKPQDDSLLPETARSQITQNVDSFKNKLEVTHNLPLRNLNLNILHLLKNDLSSDIEPKSNLTIKSLKFLLLCINHNLETILVSKIKRRTFLSKNEHNDVSNLKIAEECAKSVYEILPNLTQHLQYISQQIENQISGSTQEESEFIFTAEILDCLCCLENIYTLFTIYLKWVIFKNHNSLLKCSLRTISSIDDTDNSKLISLKDLVLAVVKYLQKHEKYCLQISTAISLIDIVRTLNEYSDSTMVLKILKGMAQSFLSQQWKTSDGTLEKGVIFNQNLDKLIGIYFINNEILTLKTLTLQLTNDIQALKNCKDTLNSFKCINKANFSILYRNLGSAVYEASKSTITKGLTNSEHLNLWKDVTTILKYMTEIAKTLENKNNLTAFFKKSVPILKLFLSEGIPILEIELKNNTEEVLEILKNLQQSTRFLQSLCCHSRLRKDTALMSKVPIMRQLLETLLYKVKAVLASNNCTEAFWMGNLKNKNIHGEVISTQQSIQSEVYIEDSDEQLPDDDIEEIDDDMLGVDSRGASDIV